MHCWLLKSVSLVLIFHYLSHTNQHARYYSLISSENSSVLLRLKRMQRLKAFAEGQRKIRYEYRKTIADSRPRVKGRFVKECTPGLPLQEDPSGTDHRPDQRLMSSLEGERLPVSEDPSTHGGSSSLNTAAAAAQLRYAMSEINLEAVALALSKSRKLSGGAASGCHPPTIHRRSLMSSSTVITDRELDELGKSLGSPFKSNQVWLYELTSFLFMGKISLAQ